MDVCTTGLPWLGRPPANLSLRRANTQHGPVIEEVLQEPRNRRVGFQPQAHRCQRDWQSQCPVLWDWAVTDVDSWPDLVFKKDMWARSWRISSVMLKIQLWNLIYPVSSECIYALCRHRQLPVKSAGRAPQRSLCYNRGAVSGREFGLEESVSRLFQQPKQNLIFHSSEIILDVYFILSCEIL